MPFTCQTGALEGSCPLLIVTPFILQGRSRFRECPELALVIGLSGGHEEPEQASGQGWTERQARPPAHGGGTQGCLSPGSHLSAAPHSHPLSL